MIKDRLTELKDKAGPNAAPSQSQGHVNETALANEEDEKFFEDVNTQKANVDELTKRVNDLNHKHNALINPVDADENQLRREVDDANAAIQSLATKTNTGLKKMKNRLDNTRKEIAAAEEGGSAAGTRTTQTTKAMLRGQQSHYNVLTRRFKEVMESYSREQMQYKYKLKNRLKKQLKVVDENHQFDDDKIDEMIESGNMEVFDQGFLQIQQNKQILDELEVRKKEMLNLEKAITELHALFVEMANLVDEQGEMVNRILDNVTNTEAYVEKAVEDVHQAARYQSGARRKKLWLVILCLIVLAVIALIIFLSIQK